MLDQMAPRYRLSWPREEIERVEPTLGRTFSLAPEIAMPGFVKAVKYYYGKWRELDQLRIAIAARRFRLETGAWPVTLDELVPRYMPRPLLEPLTGKAYQPIIEDDDFRLASPHDAGEVWSLRQILNPEKS